LASGGLTECKDCGVQEGYLKAMQSVLPQVRTSLEQAMCGTGDKECTVHITGHGPGAAVAQLVAWELMRENYVVGASYMFGSPKAGDAHFAKSMKDYFDGKILGPIMNVVADASGKAMVTDEESTGDACKSALAPGGDFCTPETNQCYGGMPL